MKKVYLFLIVFLASFVLFGCEETSQSEDNNDKLVILNDDNITISVGRSIFLEVKNETGLDGQIKYSSSNDYVSVNQLGIVSGEKPELVLLLHSLVSILMK